MRRHRRGVAVFGALPLDAQHRHVVALLAGHAQRALDLEARTHQTPRNHEISQARQRQQLRSSTREGAHSPYTRSAYAKDVITQVPQFLEGFGKGSGMALATFVVGAIIGQFLGYYFIRRIVNIKV